jgi:hypothetical protein
VLLGTIYLVAPILTAAYLAYRLQRAGRGRDRAEHPEVFAGAA